MAAEWLELVDELYEGSWNAELGRFRSPFAFRGTACIDHGLTSSLVRLADGRADVRRLENGLLRNFRKYARGETERPDSVWDWLALGQHRGLPTRLLDWSYSPLVAMHFATSDPSTFETDGAVWCVNFVEANRLLPRKLKAILREEGSDTFTVEMLAPLKTLRDFDRLSRRPFVIFLEPPALEHRILNQLALFSVTSDPEASFDDWLTTHPSLVRRVVIPARVKWEIRDKLDQANINERVLFPGLDGLSQWLTRYYTPATGGVTDDRDRHSAVRRRQRLASGRSPKAAGR